MLVVFGWRSRQRVRGDFVRSRLYSRSLITRYLAVLRRVSSTFYEKYFRSLPMMATKRSRSRSSSAQVQRDSIKGLLKTVSDTAGSYATTNGPDGTCFCSGTNERNR